MNTSVPPITTPIITPSPADKVIDGIMENIPVQVEIKTGDNIMLQVLMNTASGENGLFKMNAFVNGEQIKQPLDVKISQNVNFPPESVVNVKVTGKDASGLQIRLLSVNGEKPENFLLKAETGKRAHGCTLVNNSYRFKRYAGSLAPFRQVRNKLLYTQNTVYILPEHIAVFTVKIAQNGFKIVFVFTHGLSLLSFVF